MTENFIVDHYWRAVARDSEDNIKEALITGYKNGVSFHPHNYVLLNRRAETYRVLDFGCGIGRNFAHLRHHARSITAYDIPEMIAACRKFADCDGVDLTADWNDVVSQDYELTIATLTLQHITPRAALDVYLKGIANVSAFLYVSSRAWCDGKNRENVLQCILESGHFRFYKGTVSQQEALSIQYPSEVHLEFIVQSLCCRHSGSDSEKIFDTSVNSYDNWIRNYDLRTDEMLRSQTRKSEHWNHQPLISVIMPVYNASPRFLQRAIESVLQQSYGNWELCIADDRSDDTSTVAVLNDYAQKDSRIKLVFRDCNGHISAASNTAAKLAHGEYLALLDHDDELSPDALFYVAQTIRNHPDAAIIYSDEDKIDESGRRSAPYFKCDWNYDLFLSQNLISHLGVYRADLFNQVGGFREGTEGSQDYDLALRVMEVAAAERILHIPRVLYHWRMTSDSVSVDIKNKPYALDAALRAIQDHLDRVGRSASVHLSEEVDTFTRVMNQVSHPNPPLTIVIPTRDRLPLLQRCVDSILSKTQYTNYSILIIDNDSIDEVCLDYLSVIGKNERVQVVSHPGRFNYAAMMNFAVNQLNTELFVMLNNDTEVLHGDWLTELASQIERPGVGVVGARLWYPGFTLQHAGVILGMNGVAGHHSRGKSRGDPGYFGRAALLQNLSAVTGACMASRKSIFEAVGGMNEKDLAISFNDIDYCLKVRQLGYQVVWTPYAELIHHESASRGQNLDKTVVQQLESEANYIRKTWPDILKHDPAYSPNLSNENEQIDLAFPPRI